MFIDHCDVKKLCTVLESSDQLDSDSTGVCVVSFSTLLSSLNSAVQSFSVHVCASY